MEKIIKIISTVSAVIAATIMLQTLYFKFTAAPESVYIFTTLQLEPYGRILIGVFELIASILIIIPSTRLFGSLAGIGIMMGAIFFHLTTLGINVMNDGGYLFFLCLTVLLASTVCLFIERKKFLRLVTSIFHLKLFHSKDRSTK